MTDKQIIANLTAKLEAAIKPKWIDLKTQLPEVSHNEIVIKNSRGWTRIVRFLNTIKHGRQFVDCYDQPLKGFGATHFYKLPES